METQQSLTEWTDTHPLALVVFTTPDCGVCNAIKPRLATLEQEHELLSVQYVDTIASPELAAQFSVFTVPVLALFVGGRETVRFARYFGFQEIEDAVSRYEWLIGEEE
jgi:thiol-disulfide isomerase/thioredoxin